MAAVPVAEGSSPRLRLALLRAFELRREGQCVDLPMSTQRLVAFLAVRSCPVHRLHVAGTLWMDTCEERSGANLRTAIWRLRRADSELVETTATHVRLGPGVAVDVHGALAQAKRLLDQSDDCELIEPPWSGLGADLLPDWYDDWVVSSKSASARSGCTRSRRSASASRRCAASPRLSKRVSPPSLGSLSGRARSDC